MDDIEARYAALPEDFRKLVERVAEESTREFTLKDIETWAEKIASDVAKAND